MHFHLLVSPFHARILTLDKTHLSSNQTLGKYQTRSCPFSISAILEITIFANKDTFMLKGWLDYEACLFKC